MRKIFIVFLITCTFYNPVFLFAARKSRPIQNIEISEEDEAAEQIKANEESDEMRLKAEDVLAKDLLRAEEALEKYIEEFEKIKFPEEIKEEKIPEGQ